MAEVTSGSLTVIVLNSAEAEALTHIFVKYGRLMPQLDELANSMIGRPPAQHAQHAQPQDLSTLSNWRYSGGDWVLDDEETTNIDRKRP